MDCLNIEEALQQMEAKYYSIFENAISGIFQTTPEGRYLSANPALARIYGYDSTDEMTICLTDISHQLYVESQRRNEFISALQEHDIVSDFESQIYRRDGTVIWISENARAVRNQNGELLYYEGFVEDITQRKQAESGLRESEERLRLVIESVKDYAIFMLDTDGYVASWNSGAERIFGYKSYEIIGQHSECFYTQEGIELSKPKEKLATAIVQGRYEDEGWRIRKDGSRFWVKVIVTALRDESGELRGFSQVMQDITKQKQAETERVQAEDALKHANEVLECRVQERTSQLESAIQQLRLSEEKFSKAFRSSPDSMTITTFAGGLFIDVNDSFLSMLGYSQQEVIGETVAQLNIWVRVEDRVDFRRILQKKGVVRNQECEFKMKSGSVVVCLLSAELINLDGELCMVAVMTDITDRKHAEEALRESQRALATLMSNLPGMAYRFRNDTDRSMEFVSEGCYQLAGYSPEEFIGTRQISLSELTHPDDRDTFCNAVEVALRENRPYQLTYRITSKSGEVKWVWEQGLGVFSESGELIALEGLITDISEQKRSEEALLRSQTELTQQKVQLENTLHELQQTQAVLIHTEKMSTLGQMVAGVAHEINNPVSSVCGNLVHLSHYTDDLLDLLALYQENFLQPPAVIRDKIEEIELDFLLEDLPKAMSSMQVGADRIREIVRSLQIFSRKDDNKMSRVNLHEGIDGTLLILQSRLRAKGSHPEIAVIKEYGNLPLVECYAGKVNQVFMNLIGNAIDAIEEYNQGRSIVEVKANRSKIKIKTEIRNSQVIVRISDNGPGMPEEVSKQLFDAFFTTKPAGKGTGLGLSISHKVVQEHNGKLSCISAPGQGAEFIIELPIEQISQ